MKTIFTFARSSPLEALIWGAVLLVSVMISSVASAPSEDLIPSLPGQPDVGFKLYGGYVTVDEAHGRALYYYFVEAETNPSSKPLTLWLNGGPGCSSLGGGGFTELGPFYPSESGLSLIKNGNSWNQVANIIFLESPAGVGFSYSNTTSDYTTGDVKTAGKDVTKSSRHSIASLENVEDFYDSLLSSNDESLKPTETGLQRLRVKQTYMSPLPAQDSLKFLLGWFKKFPEYLQNDFYIAGESYAGHYAPQLADAILKYNKGTGQTQIRLKGIMIGNPLIDYEIDTVYSPIVFLWSHGLVSQDVYQIIMNNCKFDNSSAQPSSTCNRALVEAQDQADWDSGYIDPYDVLGDVCWKSSMQEARRLKIMVLKKEDVLADVAPNPCIEEADDKYLNLPEVQSALHAKSTSWSMCSDAVNYPESNLYTPMLPVLRHLLDSGLRVWVFSGDQDSIIPLIGTRELMDRLGKELNKGVTSPTYRAWFQGEQVAGWTRSWGNLTYATVKGAGHLVPRTQGARSLQLFTSYLAGGPIPSKPQ